RIPDSAHPRNAKSVPRFPAANPRNPTPPTNSTSTRSPPRRSTANSSRKPRNRDTSPKPAPAAPAGNSPNPPEPTRPADADLRAPLRQIREVPRPQQTKHQPYRHPAARRQIHPVNLVTAIRHRTRHPPHRPVIRQILPSQHARPMRISAHRLHNILRDFPFVK